MILIEHHRNEMIEKRAGNMDDRNRASVAKVRAIGCFKNPNAARPSVGFKKYFGSFPNLHRNAVTNVTPGVYPHRRHGASQQVPEMVSK